MVGVVVSFTKLYQYYDFKRFERMIWKIQAFLVLILGKSYEFELFYQPCVVVSNNSFMTLTCGSAAEPSFF